jgi:hypothetical protein
MQANLVQTVTSTTKQDILAQRSCPACFGESFPVTNPTQPTDNSKVFVCLDGNFQHRHHERASKNYVALEDQPLFIKPDELELANSQILEGERSNRVSEKAVRTLIISFHVLSVLLINHIECLYHSERPLHQTT